MRLRIKILGLQQIINFFHKCNDFFHNYNSIMKKRKKLKKLLHVRQERFFLINIIDEAVKNIKDNINVFIKNSTEDYYNDKPCYKLHYNTSRFKTEYVLYTNLYVLDKNNILNTSFSYCPTFLDNSSFIKYMNKYKNVYKTSTYNKIKFKYKDKKYKFEYALTISNDNYEKITKSQFLKSFILYKNLLIHHTKVFEMKILYKDIFFQNIEALAYYIIEENDLSKNSN